MPNFENAFNTVCDLVKDFKENESRYLSPQYQEAEVRRDYIDKLFEALGWDVYHRTQKNPYEQEVKVEKGVSVGKAQKRADYAFYIAPEFRQPKFFCEAKKPSRSLKNTDDYFQTIRYGWNSNTPVAVLTDFEEFHILDCRYKPKLNNVLENPNHKSYTYNDYANPEKFKEIYYLFSRDDVAKNSLEKYSESFPKGKAKGKTSFKSVIKTIDDDFLEYIDEVRETLAKAFKKNDSKLSSEELTEATQRTIDRIVFIRFLEDKLIEPEYYISEFGKKGNAWNEFISVCRKLDAKYNGIVFKKHFIDEQNFQGPEQSTFKKICDEMSYLNSPYDFNAIPIHILGSIYERFLGKVVNATAQRVKVEEKPEVRKAGGVYYTPKYIVDYIVDNTVGKILRNEESSGGTTAYDKDKSNNLEDCLTFPKESTVRFIPITRDIPACGKDKSNNLEDCLTFPKESTARFIPITRDIPACGKDKSNNISRDTRQEHAGMTNMGVGKTPAEISKLRFADIACGSGSFLIGVFETLLKYHTEYYQLHPEEAKKDGCINKDGQWILSIKQKQNILLNNIYGVDIDNQAVEVTQLSLALKMLEDESTATANEMQVLFHEKILPDLSKNIVCGNSLIGTDIVYEESSGAGLFERKRKITIEEERKLNPMDFEKRFPHIFKSPPLAGDKGGGSSTNGFDAIVGNPPYEITLGKESKNNHSELLNVNNYFKLKYQTIAGEINLYKIFIERAIKLLSKDGYFGYIMPTSILNDASNNKLRHYLLNAFKFIEINQFPEKARVFKNVTQDVCIYIFNNRLTKISIKNNLMNNNDLIEKESIYIEKDVIMKLNTRIPLFKDYNSVYLISKLLNQKSINDFKSQFLISEGEIHLTKYKEAIRDEKGDNIVSMLRGDMIKRYDLIESQKSSFVDEIIVKNISNSPKFKFVNKQRLVYQQVVNIQKERRLNFYFLNNKSYLANTCGFVVIEDSSEYSLKYLLGLFNSALLNWRYKITSSNNHILTNELYQLPFKEINFQNESEKQSHDRIVSLVNEMLEAKKQLQTAKTDRDKTYYENKCADLDYAIDSEVYKLYGLTDEEIRIVEGKGMTTHFSPLCHSNESWNPE